MTSTQISLSDVGAGRAGASGGAGGRPLRGVRGVVAACLQGLRSGQGRSGPVTRGVRGEHGADRAGCICTNGAHVCLARQNRGLPAWSRPCMLVLGCVDSCKRQLVVLAYMRLTASRTA